MLGRFDWHGVVGSPKDATVDEEKKGKKELKREREKKKGEKGKMVETKSAAKKRKLVTLGADLANQYSYPGLMGVNAGH